MRPHSNNPTTQEFLNMHSWNPQNLKTWSEMRGSLLLAQMGDWLWHVHSDQSPKSLPVTYTPVRVFSHLFYLPQPSLSFQLSFFSPTHYPPGRTLCLFIHHIRFHVLFCMILCSLFFLLALGLSPRREIHTAATRGDSRHSGSALRSGGESQ